MILAEDTNIQCVSVCVSDRNNPVRCSSAQMCVKFCLQTVSVSQTHVVDFNVCVTSHRLYIRRNVVVFFIVTFFLFRSFVLVMCVFVENVTSTAHYTHSLSLVFASTVERVEVNKIRNVTSNYRSSMNALCNFFFQEHTNARIRNDKRHTNEARKKTTFKKALNTYLASALQSLNYYTQFIDVIY